MQYGLLGYYGGFNCNNMHYIDFSSKQTLLDYDVLIVDLKNIFECYGSSGNYKGKRLILQDDAIRLKKDLSTRKNEIDKFLKSGKRIICVSANAEEVYIYREVGQGFSEVSADLLFPCKFKHTELKGKKIHFSNKKIEKELSDYKKYLEYNTVYDDVESIKQFMTVDKSSGAVCFFEKIYDGIILFAPDIDVETINERINYFNTLSTISLFSENDTELPEYSKNYFMPAEKETINIIENLIKSRQDIDKEIEKREKELLQLQNSKTIFTGTGRQLEKIVVDILKKIGFSIIKYEENSVDEDVILEYKENKIVVEIKGVSGSAAERNTAQVIKWKMEYYVENGVMPKGVLIVNAFNNKKLEDRQEYFPEQMLKYANIEEICLITTIQLYNLMMQIENNPNEKDKLITELLNCSGRYKKFCNWDEYISK